MFILSKQFHFILFGLKIIGHGNYDNHLESLCIIIVSINTKYM
jgi:hypothetical protein